MIRQTKFVKLIPWLICALGALFYAYEYFLRITPSVMTENLKMFYQIKDEALGSLSAYYYYIYTPMQLLVGVLMDRYGPRRLLTIATISCVMGSILFASTHSLSIAKVGRLFIGFGSAFAYVGVLKLGTIWLPRRHFAAFTGFATALGMLGAVMGDNVMTAMTNAFGWQNTVMVSALFGIVLALFIGVFVRDNKISDRKHKASSKQVSYAEAFRGTKKIIKTPQFWIIGIIGALLYIPASVFAELWGIPYLENSLNFSNSAAASAISLVFIGWAVGGPIYGWTSDRIKKRVSPLVFASAVSAIIVSILLFESHRLPVWSIYVLLFAFGMAASGQVIVFALGKELGPTKLAGSSIAFTNMAVMLGGAILQPVLGAILQQTQQDYSLALVTMPISLILSAFLAKYFLRETHCKSLKQSPRERAGFSMSYGRG